MIALLVLAPGAVSLTIFIRPPARIIPCARVRQGGVTENDRLYGLDLRSDGTAYAVGTTLGDWFNFNVGEEDFAAVKLGGDGEPQWGWQVRKMIRRTHPAHLGCLEDSSVVGFCRIYSTAAWLPQRPFAEPRLPARKY